MRSLEIIETRTCKPGTTSREMVEEMYLSLTERKGARIAGWDIKIEGEQFCLLLRRGTTEDFCKELGS